MSRNAEKNNLEVIGGFSRVEIDENDVLAGTGWILSPEEIDKIEVYCNRKYYGRAIPGIVRSDLYKMYPQYNNLESGFMFTYKINEISIINEVTLKVYSKNRVIKTMKKTIKREFNNKIKKHYLATLDKLPPYFKETTIVNDVVIGKYTYGYKKFCRPNTAVESIGAFCSINSEAEFGYYNHPQDYITTHPSLFVKNDMWDLLDKDTKQQYKIRNNEKIIIGNDVWIGVGAIILPSVRIGNGAIIGAGAVVTKNVPDYSIVVGAPAKVIKYRFTEEKVKALNEIQWWNWSDDKIRDNARYFVNNEMFFESFSKKS